MSSLKVKLLQWHGFMQVQTQHADNSSGTSLIYSHYKTGFTSWHAASVQPVAMIKILHCDVVF